MMGSLPWAALMQVGLATLRLPPDAFWAMTPREFAAAAGVPGRWSAPLDRDGLTRLMALHPDAPCAVKEMDDERLGE